MKTAIPTPRFSRSTPDALLLSVLILAALPTFDLPGGRAAEPPVAEPPAAGPAVAADLQAAAFGKLETLIRREIDAGFLKGLSLAIVDDQQLVWAAGYGLADVKGRLPATPETVYRVGSLSKLVTALAVVALVDRGLLDIDRPIEAYDPEFRIGREKYPRARPTTLRQLMTHRSGFPRESPVGSYFDPSEPGLERTVRSLSTCQLVNEPGSTTKYSNIAVALEGHIAARVAGKEFEILADELILRPAGMSSSSFRKTPEVSRKLARGYMGLPDGSEIVAPVFELGTIPAGNLYSSVLDMARFLSFLFRDCRTPDGQVIGSESLREMYRVQFPSPFETTGFGLGFWIGDLDGRKSVGHSGAVYGFSTQILFLPAEKLGVIVCANQDVVSGITGAIARRALQWILAARAAGEGPAIPEVVSPGVGWPELAEGTYRKVEGWVEVLREGGRLRADLMGLKHDLRPVAEGRYLLCGPSVYESPVEVVPGGLRLAGKLYEGPVPESREVGGEEAWKEYVGTYGPPFIPTVVEVRHGRLYALVENAFGYEMVPDGNDAFSFPAGLYEGERLTFVRDGEGKVAALRIGPVEFARKRS